MFRFDEQEWPLVILHNEGETTLADMQHYIANWERWLARKEPFGLLLNQSGEVIRPAKEVNALSNQWLLHNKPRIAQYCVGAAMLTASSKLLVLYKPIAAKITQKRMGCPGQIFTIEADARSWLTLRLTQSKL